MHINKDPVANHRLPLDNNEWKWKRIEEKPDKFAAMSKLVYDWYDKVGRNMYHLFTKR